MTRSDQPTVVWLWGEQDLMTSSMSDDTLVEAIARPEADVVVDVSDVSFMDCAGLGPLLLGRAVLAGQARHLTLRSPPMCVRILLDACGLAHLVEPTGTLIADRGAAGSRNALQTWVELPAANAAWEVPVAPVDAMAAEREPSQASRWGGRSDG
ncbi:MAG: STAS domain-containing protein [Acidimicrobiales bacterium]